MENERYLQEGIDLKRVFLLWRKKAWWFAAAILAGAAAGGGIYLLVHFMNASRREYETVSKIYLNFNCEPEDFSELAYNGYTWNDLMATDPILNYTMEKLPPEVGRETVVDATKAEILSDIRLLTVTITAPRQELAAEIMEATQSSLVHLGETDELFESIEIYSTTEPKQIVWDNRTARAAVTGAAAALFAALIAAAFSAVMDDSVYVAADVEKRYGIPGMGILTAEKPEHRKNNVHGKRDDDGKKDGSGKRDADGKSLEGGSEWEREILTNYRYLCRGMRTVAVASADGLGDAERAGRRIEELSEEAEASEAAGSKADGGGHNSPCCRVFGTPGEDKDWYSELRETDGVILAVRYGGRNGKKVERLLGNLRQQDCRVVGAVIVDGDKDFLRSYYKGWKLI